MLSASFLPYWQNVGLCEGGGVGFMSGMRSSQLIIINLQGIKLVFKITTKG